MAKGAVRVEDAVGVGSTPGGAVEVRFALGHGSHLLGGEHVVQIVEIQSRGRRLAKGGREDGGGERWQRVFELRRDERERLVLHVELAVELDSLGLGLGLGIGLG